MTVEALRERILRGDYPEGEPLRQDALADELGVHQTTVSGWLRLLVLDKVLELVKRGHRGLATASIGAQSSLIRRSQ